LRGRQRDSGDGRRHELDLAVQGRYNRYMHGAQGGGGPEVEHADLFLRLFQHRGRHRELLADARQACGRHVMHDGGRQMLFLLFDKFDAMFAIRFTHRRFCSGWRAYLQLTSRKGWRSFDARIECALVIFMPFYCCNAQ
jgi:hypothetical protein